MDDAPKDRALLELAAQAAGIDAEIHSELGLGPEGLWLKGGRTPDNHRYWNPLTDDGDALRLAVRLNILVFPYDDETSTGTIGVTAKNWGSKEANTRRAIVRAAAAIGSEPPQAASGCSHTARSDGQNGGEQGATPPAPATPPGHWDEYAMREADRLWNLPAMPKSQLVASLHCALIEAMRFSATHASDREAALLLACESAISWLDGWASAEPYVTILRNAISDAPGGAWNRMTPNTKPVDGQTIVKRWKNGSVWAGTFTGGAKNESFDWWLPLPPCGVGGAA